MYTRNFAFKHTNPVWKMTVFCAIFEVKSSIGKLWDLLRHFDKNTFFIWTKFDFVIWQMLNKIRAYDNCVILELIVWRFCGLVLKVLIEGPNFLQPCHLIKICFMPSLKTQRANFITSKVRESGKSQIFKFFLPSGPKKYHCVKSKNNPDESSVGSLFTAGQ